MATPKKTAQGTWRVQIDIRGVRDSYTGPTKRDAEEWQARRKSEILSDVAGVKGSNKTLEQALDEYAEKVSPTKRGERWELIRLAAFKRQLLPLGRKLSDVTTADLVRWRDSRLAVNARGSVLRDITLLGHVFEVARREWQWIESNPMRDVKRPQNPDHREIVISGVEIRGMLRVLGYGWPVRSVAQAVAACFLFALCTGMRAGELCGLKWDDVRADYVRLPMTKNGSSRNVPLSPVAQRILERMKGWDDLLVFGIGSQSLSSMFIKYRIRAGLSGFTFHDARHTAATRLAMSRKVDALQLCRIFGWKNPKQALCYFNPTASELARVLQ